MYVYFHVDSKTESIILLKRIPVFCIITITWVFFRIPDMEVALHTIKNMLLFQSMTLFDSNLLTIAGLAVATIKIAVALLLFLYIQYWRKDAEKLSDISETIRWNSMLVVISVIVYVHLCNDFHYVKR